MTDEPDRSPEEGGVVSTPGDGAARRAVTASRADGEPEWELFLRESPTEPLRHAGSITAPGAEVAHERATGLFPEATTLWCCPSEAVARFTGRDLGGDYRDEGAGAAAERTTNEAVDGAEVDTRGERP